MREIVEFLNENTNGFLATLEGGKPRVRPYQFMLEDGGKLCFSTNNTKEVCKQLMADPSMEFSASNAKGGWIRLRGEAKFSGESRIKQLILDGSETVRAIYKTPDNPMFEVFFLDKGMAQIMDAAGQPIRKIEF
ncbi:MAG: pyridoxamine 5'-phosphate oxidase family protein [Spirochaetaceae bacterium]|nr:pyridoxamine 5'-phosphate oxidase family protein [Spirochaetaceae bacterium]